jgi:hypothetical protein
MTRPASRSSRARAACPLAVVPAPASPPASPPEVGRRTRPVLEPGPVVGSLCTGYGGLDLGVLAALGGGRIAWVADPDPHIRLILDARMPITDDPHSTPSGCARTAGRTPPVIDPDTFAAAQRAPGTPARGDAAGPSMDSSARTEA